MFLYNVLRSKCDKRNECVKTIICLLIRAKRNVYSMWNELDVGDV